MSMFISHKNELPTMTKPRTKHNVKWSVENQLHWQNIHTYGVFDWHAISITSNEAG